MTGRPTALVTGASSGIGAAAAHVLGAAGYDLVLVARRADRLATVATQLRDAGVGVEALPADLATTGGLERVVDRVATGPVDLLVSNAGASAYRPLAEFDAAEVENLWRLNATAHITLAHAALPSMLNKGSGGIITVASLLAFSAGIDMGFPRTLYVAAKSAVVAFTRSLALELRDTAVTATVVCPGLVDTEWSEGANRGDPRAMPAQDVVDAMWTAHRRGEALCVPGIDDPTLIRHWEQHEPALLQAGNHAQLANRYRNSGP
ncbi:SDR family NAD(P)-dependent oxidoreductase [Kitasatospora sp. NBC_00315]|uniref:SDR family NAD(P)-dependent oxidoreductase n=1 Tax=Kitasatospora sp. NBC_00315 TaxID=2975963 RepID=UPI0032566EC1